MAALVIGWSFEENEPKSSSADASAGPGSPQSVRLCLVPSCGFL